jgi:hypothetical protein
MTNLNSILSDQNELKKQFLQELEINPPEEVLLFNKFIQKANLLNSFDKRAEEREENLRKWKKENKIDFAKGLDKTLNFGEDDFIFKAISKILEVEKEVVSVSEHYGILMSGNYFENKDIDSLNFVCDAEFNDLKVSFENENLKILDGEKEIKIDFSFLTNSNENLTLGIFSNSQFIEIKVS